MFLLDTNVLSELRRRERTDPKVAAWSDSVHPSDMYISAITILEVEAGALLLARRDASAGSIIRAWIDNRVLPTFKDRILPVDTEVALRCAQLHVPDPKAERDAMIAATALVHRMKLVTRNVGDFKHMVGIDLLNPWE